MVTAVRVEEEEAVIDFTIPEEIQQIRARVAAFIDAHVLPAEADIGTRPYFAIVADLQAKARAAGLWCPFIPAEWGGWALARWRMRSSRSRSAAPRSRPGR